MSDRSNEWAPCPHCGKVTWQGQENCEHCLAPLRGEASTKNQSGEILILTPPSPTVRPSQDIEPKRKLDINADLSGATIQINLQTKSMSSTEEEPDMSYREYRVHEVMEGGCGTLLFHSSKVPIRKLEELLNREAVSGWQCVFMVIERKRFLLFWQRESVIVTMGR